MQGLVWSTWAIIAALLALVFLSYNLFPDFEDPRWVGRGSTQKLAAAGNDLQGRLSGAASFAAAWML